jgi:hypothetical protein
MKTRLVKKRRLARARAHQAHARLCKQVTVDDEGIEQATGLAPPTPARALCPSCSTRQKVRKDGTIGGHNVYFGSDPLEPVNCQGVGARWDA